SGIPEARLHRCTACQSGTHAGPERRKIMPRFLRRRTAIARDEYPWQSRHGTLTVLACLFPAGCDQRFRHLRRGCKECTKYRLAIQADLRVEQRRTAGDERPFCPLPSAVAQDHDFLPHPAVKKFLAGVTATETDDLPSDEHCVSYQYAAHAELGDRAI